MVYSEVYGEIIFTAEEGAQRVRRYLIDGGWLTEEEDGLVWEEGGDNGHIPATGRSVIFNGGIQRNIHRVVEYILDNPEEFGYLDDASWLRVCSVDGDVFAGVLNLQPAEREGEFTGEISYYEEGEIRGVTGFDMAAYVSALGEELDLEIVEREEKKISEWVADAA